MTHLELSSILLEVPPQLEEEVEIARSEMIENLSDYDDEMMNLYLEGQEVPEDMLRRTIRKAAISLKIVPVMCGSAFKNSACAAASGCSRCVSSQPHGYASAHSSRSYELEKRSRSIPLLMHLFRLWHSR